jgi:hypothetical protein
MNKAKHKKKHSMFWPEGWRYYKTVEEWIDSLYDGAFSSTYQRDVYRDLIKDLLFSAIDQLVLERKILKQQGERMKEMIASPDKENALLAIQIMAGLKPRKFKKSINQKNKTNE